MKREVKNFEGYCLVATAAHAGDYFARSLILVTHHDAADGTLGLIINRPTAHILSDFLKEESEVIGDAKVYTGGPVEPNILSILGIFFEGKKLTLKTHVTPAQARKFLKEHAEQSQLRGYLGYAGWSAGQLEEEIERGEWTLMPFTPAMLEPVAGETLWAWAAQS